MDGKVIMTVYKPLIEYVAKNTELFVSFYSNYIVETLLSSYSMKISKIIQTCLKFRKNTFK